MSPLVWVLSGALVAGLADLLIVWVMRLRRSGRWPRLQPIRPRVPRQLPLLLLLGGAALLFLGQSLEAPSPATGARLAGQLAVLGVVLVAASGMLYRNRPAHAEPDNDQKGKTTITKAKGKSGRESERNAERAVWTSLLLGSAVLLFIGSSMNSYLFETDRGWLYVYTGLGLVCFFLAAIGFSRRSLPSRVQKALGAVSNWLGVSPPRVVLLGLSPVLALSAWLAAGDSVRMRQPTIALLSWLAGILLVLIAGTNRPIRLGRGLRFSPEVLGLGGIFLIGFLLRGLATEQVPWLFTGDEASAGLSAVQFIDGFRDNLFGVAWFSFPSLFFFVQSLSIRIFGQTEAALRVVSALAGALTIPVTFALANEMFGKRVAWVSAVYLAVFHFHIHFSRIGLNNIWDGFFVAAFAACFWRAWKSNHRLAFAGAGIVLGLSQYFYVSIRVVLPFFILWCATALIKDRQVFRLRLPGFSILLLGLLVSSLPLAIFFLRHPQEFGAPLGRVAALGPWLRAETLNTGREAWELMLTQFRTAALGFTSVNLRLSYEPGEPMLLALPASLFLMGVSLIVVRLRELRSIWLGLWLMAAVFVGGLSLSPPASQRYLLVVPAVAILVALPLVTVAEWLAEAWPAWRRAAVAAALAVLAIAAWSDLRFYFGQFATGPAFGDINTETAQSLALWLASQEDQPFVYFLGGRMGLHSHSNIAYLAPQTSGLDLPEPVLAPSSLEVRRHTLFVVLPERETELGAIQSAFPGGRTFRNYGRNQVLFIGYEIGGS